MPDPPAPINDADEASGTSTIVVLALHPSDTSPSNPIPIASLLVMSCLMRRPARTLRPAQPFQRRPNGRRRTSVGKLRQVALEIGDGTQRLRALQAARSVRVQRALAR